MSISGISNIPATTPPTNKVSDNGKISPLQLTADQIESAAAVRSVNISLFNNRDSSENHIEGIVTFPVSGEKRSFYFEYTNFPGGSGDQLILADDRTSGDPNSPERISFKSGKAFDEVSKFILMIKASFDSVKKLH